MSNLFSLSLHVFIENLGRSFATYWYQRSRGQLLIVLHIFLAGLFQSFAQCPTDIPQLPSSICSDDTIALAAPAGVVSAEWDFCSGDFFKNFSTSQISTATSVVATPRALSLVNDGANWYGFVHNSNLGNLYRIDFGTSLGTTIQSVTQVTYTTATTAIGSSAWSKLKFYKQGSSWYAFGVTEGNVLARLNFPAGGLGSNTISFNSFNNTNGLALSGAWDMDLITRNDTIFLVAVNYNGAGLRVYSLGTSATNTPTLIYSTTLTGLSSPNSIDVVRHCGEFYAMVSSYADNKIATLKFGNNLNSPPVIQILSSTSTLSAPIKVFLTRENNQWIGIVKHRSNSLEFSRIFFGETLTTAADSIKLYSNISGIGVGWAMDVVTDESKSQIWGINNNGSKPLYRLLFNQPCTDVQVDQGLSIENTELSVGTYITEANYVYSSGIRASVSDTITILPEVVAGMSVSGICEQDSFELTSLSTSPNSAITSDSWFIEGYGSFSGSAIQFEGATADTVMVQLVSANSFGCQGVLDTQLIVHPKPDVNISADSTCRGSEVLIQNTSTIAFDSISGYRWLFGGADSSISPTPNYMFLDTGWQQIQLALTSNFGCFAQDSIQVFIKDAPIADFSVRRTCIGDSTLFSNSSGSNMPYDVHWTFGDGAFSALEDPSHFYAISGNYLVNLNVLANNGCGSDDSMVISITTAPLAQIAFIDSIKCTKQELLLVANSVADSISDERWYNQEIEIGEGDSFLFFSIDSGVNVLTYIVNSGTACFDTAQISLDLNPAPELSLSVFQTCFGDTLVLESMSQALEDQSIIETAWHIDAIGDYTGDVVAIENLVSADYLAQLSVLTDSGCAMDSIFEFTIFQKPLLSLNLPQGRVCSGLPYGVQFSAIIDPSDSIISDSVLVTYPSGMINAYSSIDTAIIFAEAGNVQVTYKIETGGFCSVNESQTLVVTQSPELEISNDTICLNSAYEFSDNYSGSNYTRKWGFGDGAFATAERPTHYYSDTGTYHAHCVISDLVTGCYDSNAFEILVLSNPVVHLLSDQFCQFESATFKLVNTTELDAITKASWFFYDGRTFNFLEPNIQFQDGGDFTVFVNFETMFGCQDAVSLPFTVMDQPVFQLDISPDFGIVPVVLSVMINSDQPLETSITINDSVYTSNPAILFLNDPQTLSIQAQVIDSNGCKAAQLRTIDLKTAQIDVAVELISVSKGAGWYEATGRLTNLSNVTITEALMRASFGAEGAVEFSLVETLATGESVGFVVPKFYSASESISVVCLELGSLANFTDMKASNNKDCSVLNEGLRIVNIYPNPVVGNNDFELMVSNGDCETIDLSLFDARGNVLHNQVLSDFRQGYKTVSLSAFNLPDGAYVVAVSCNGESVSAKVIIRKSID